MKTIGLIGGMSWESSAEYYRMINEQVRERLWYAFSPQHHVICRFCRNRSFAASGTMG